MTAEVRLNLKGSLDYLGIVWQAAEGLLETIQFPEDPVQTRYNLLLAIQEALTNIIRHGHRGQLGDSEIEIVLAHSDESLTVELRDDSPAFDPTVVVDLPDVEDRENLPEGGYGLHIIRAVVDKLRYERDGTQNVLTLEKYAVPVLDEV
ncbi:MAG: ATP-binding protein [Planctomycetota bacterium]